MGILLTVAVTHPENVPTIDLQYEVIDHYFASDRMSGNVPSLFTHPADISRVPSTFFRVVSSVRAVKHRLIIKQHFCMRLFFFFFF